jgi:hypothetical protein
MQQILVITILSSRYPGDNQRNEHGVAPQNYKANDTDRKQAVKPK